MWSLFIIIPLTLAGIIWDLIKFPFLIILVLVGVWIG